jgi:hypothetical protein
MPVRMFPVEDDDDRRPRAGGPRGSCRERTCRSSWPWPIPGAGIRDADLQRIFQRFARAEPYRSRPSGGLGLGLAIVQAIAEAHGGSVTVQSTFGHGSEFEVHLPLAPGAAAVGAAGRVSPAAR